MPSLPPEPFINSEPQDRLPLEIDAPVLRKYFTLSDADLVQVEQCRGSVNRLGFAVQLCALRWRGHFLPDTQDLPRAVLETLAPQLGVLAMPIPEYPQNEKTRWEHLERIRRHLGFVKCEEPQRQQLLTHLQAQAVTMPRSQMLHVEACRWLVEQRIVRPGRTTLREIVGAAKDSALGRVYEQLNGNLTLLQQQRLDDLLLPTPAALPTESAGRSRIEQFKLLARRESPAAFAALAARLADVQAIGLATLPVLQQIHPATRALLAAWGYRYNVWSLRRFAAPKRYSILLAFLQAALAETLDAIVEMQDKLITKVHNNARERREEMLRSMERARTRAVVVLEDLGSLVIDEMIPDAELRAQIFAHWSNDDITAVVAECRQMRDRDDGSALNLLTAWYGQTRKYSPTLLAVTPFDFTRHQALGEAVNYLRKVNRDDGTKFGNDAPTNFLARRWQKYVISRNTDDEAVVSRPFYELAVLTTLNERLKAGDVTVTDSRRWTDFDDYLIPSEQWQRDRLQHYAARGLPVDADEFIHRLGEHLASVTAQVDARVPLNKSLTIDAAKGEFSLAALVGHDSSEAVKQLKHLIEIGLPHTELVDILIDIDNETDFLRHFTSHGIYTPNSSTALHRRNVLAALVAVGCNIGPQRMALASPGLNLRDISAVADWCFSEEALKAAVIDLVNYAVGLPLTKLYGRGNTCSADGMRFYVPVNVLAADYSPLLHARGVTMLTHTADNYLQFYQQAVPCKLREATFNLDGLVEHDTKLDPKTCYTDTHGYTEVVMATAALLGFELAPRIKDIKDQTLYKMDRRQQYPHLDPLLTGHLRPHLIRRSWDEVVRVIASIRSRVVSPSLILHRLGSYARQNSIYQALAEIGRVYKTIWILRYLDSEQVRRHAGRELNKGEGSHDLSRFLCFGKEGALRGREFEDQLHTFSCLAVLHNAVVAWNINQITLLVEKLRGEGHSIADRDLAFTAPLVRKHINALGRYHFDMARMKRAVPDSSETP